MKLIDFHYLQWMNPTDFGHPLTFCPGLLFMVKMAAKLFDWIAITFGTDIHVLQRMYLSDFGNPLKKIKMFHWVVDLFPEDAPQ